MHRCLHIFSAVPVISSLLLKTEYLEDEILSTAIVKQESETAIDLPSLQNVEELERMILERYKPGSSLITYAEDEAEELIDQNIEILYLEDTSASKGPIIWKVKCTVLRLIFRYLTLYKKIKSIISHIFGIFSCFLNIFDVGWP